MTDMATEHKKPEFLTLRINWETGGPENAAVMRFVEICEDKMLNRSRIMKKLIYDWVKENDPNVRLDIEDELAESRRESSLPSI